jgi:hypothetical protein
MAQAHLKITKNSSKFRGPAIHFQKHECYTFAPPGTTEYIKYWTTEAKYCMDGFTTDNGDYITGYHYFYLNYFPIILVTEDKNGRSFKKRDFPRFYDYDRFFFDAVEESEIKGHHLSVLKSRRKGYSYKVASMLDRNFYFHRESKCFALAAEQEFLTKDGILTKAWDGMDFIDANTAWYKKRQKADTKLHKRASFVQKDSTGVDIEMGYKSEIMGVTLKNDPQKARGKAGKLIIYEEAGKFRNLLQAWQISRPSVEQGSHVFGTMIAFGTGGEEGEDFEGLRELFEKPAGYNCLSFDNIWDSDAIGQQCGFFIPQYANLEGTYHNPGDPDHGKVFMDEDGNTDVRVAKRFILEERQKIIENASDKRAIDRHVAELPITPSEALLDLSSNIFPKLELKKHLANIKNDKKLSNFKQVGDLRLDKNGAVRWEPALEKSKQKDIIKYRLDPSDNPTGQVVIWEHPVEDAPFGLYIGGCDPYDFDKSGTNSLGSVFIFKRFQSFEQYYDLPVAEYTGRPETAEQFYEIVRLLLKYYKATLLYENEKKGLFFHFDRYNSLHLLADQPDGIIKDIVKDSKVQRGKGLHMNQMIKDWCEGATRDWLSEEYEPGVKNLTKIMSEPLLEELISFNDKGNFDRVMAFFMVIAYRQELHKVHVKEKKESNRDRLLFPEGGPFTGEKFERRIFI